MHNHLICYSAEEAAANLRVDPRQRECARPETDTDNLRLASTSATAQGNGGRRPIVAALWLFWVDMVIRPRGRLPSRWVLTPVALHRRAQYSASSARTVVEALASQQGDFDELLHSFCQKPGIGQLVFGAEREMAETLKWLGNLAIDTGHEQQALDLYTRSRELYERLDYTAGTVDVLSNLGIVYRRNGALGRCLAVFDESAGTANADGPSVGALARATTMARKCCAVEATMSDAISTRPSSNTKWLSGLEVGGYSVDVALALTGLGMARVENGDLVGGRRDSKDAEASFRDLSSARDLQELVQISSHRLSSHRTTSTRPANMPLARTSLHRALGRSHRKP